MPRRALHTHLASIHDILRQQGANQAMISSIPKDPQTCWAMFHIDPITRLFLCCPQCHCLYPYAPGDDPELDIQPSISHCTYQQTPTSPICNTNLWKHRRMTGERVVSEPVKKYLHQDLKHWLGRLLSRKGIEDHLTGPPHLRPGQHRPDVIDDIWLSDAFIHLKDAVMNSPPSPVVPLSFSPYLLHHASFLLISSILPILSSCFIYSCYPFFYLFIPRFSLLFLLSILLSFILCFSLSLSLTHGRFS